MLPIHLIPSLCGAPEVTCYWVPDGQMLQKDMETVPLADAVMKSRLLNQQYRGC